MAKAKGSGRKPGGIAKVRKARNVKPDGAFAGTWPYQAALADTAAAKRDAERTEEAAQEAVATTLRLRSEKAAADAAAEAQRQAKLSPRPCKRCQAVLPPDAFERHSRAYNGRMGCCRPCAELIRSRQSAPVGRRVLDKPVPAQKQCRHCETLFRPLHANVVYCSAECRTARQAAIHAAQHREAYAADWTRRRAMAKAWRAANRDKARAHRRKAYHLHSDAEKAAHAAWVAGNRGRVNACQREAAQRRAALAEAKSRFADDGFFVFIRARSGFWRGDATGQRIGVTETIMARYELVLGQWVIMPPVILSREALRFVSRMALREANGRSRRPAHRYRTTGKTEKDIAI